MGMNERGVEIALPRSAVFPPSHGSTHWPWVTTENMAPTDDRDSSRCRSVLTPLNVSYHP
jgi:hypothetical protein